MEVMIVTFDPPEPIQENDTLNTILERRFVAGFERTNTFGLPRRYSGRGRHELVIDHLAGKPTHEYSLQISDTMAAIHYSRKIPGNRRSHVLVNFEGQELQRKDSGVYFLNPEKEFRNTSNVGIARRRKGKLELEYYLYLNQT